MAGLGRLGCSGAQVGIQQDPLRDNNPVVPTEEAELRRILVLAPASPMVPEARRLAAAGAVTLVTPGRADRVSYAAFDSASQVLVGCALPLFHLKEALLRAADGDLGDVRLLLDGPPPDPDAVGYRWRPWLSGVAGVGVALPDWRPAPAPLGRWPSLAALLDAWGPPPVAWTERPSTAPAIVQIQTTTACEAHCPYCPYDDVVTEHLAMDFGLFSQIVAGLAAHPPAAIELYMHAEPLLDSRLEALADLAKQACPDALVSIVCHERALEAARVPTLAASGLDVIFVSVNFTGRPRPAAVERRLTRLAAFAAVLKPAGTRLVITTLANFLDTPTHRVMTRSCRRLGLPLERFHATRRAGDVQVERFARTAAKGGRCERPFLQAYIRHDGRLNLCCEDWRYRRDLGSVVDTPLPVLWNGDAYRTVRRELDDGNVRSPCDRCDYRGARSADDGARVDVC